ncbi:MAG: NfeD family protein [Acidobacteriota bacterium]|nr:NfeD family protein [Acidobacteriota bacterium]
MPAAPDGLIALIIVLAVGYLLLLAELFVPGGVLGLVGFVVVLYACYLAFDMGPLWGTAVVLLSMGVTAAGVHFFFRSRTGRALVLDSPDPPSWRSQEEDLSDLIGRRGQTVTDLRPSGTMELEGRRLDVVADGEFLDAGTAVEVVEVEGGRVVVESVAEVEAADPEIPTDPPARHGAEELAAGREAKP